MSGPKPIVGITVDFQEVKGATPAFMYVADGYRACLEAAGATVVILPPSDDDNAHEQYLDFCDGIVFVGGRDLDPRRDGFMLHSATKPMAACREASERRLLLCASRRRTPVFGIGVGMQLLNVMMGGNLFLHIPEDLPKSRNMHHDPSDPNHRHILLVEPHTFIGDIYGDGEIRVSSRHHMAVDGVAPGFIVSARARDGVVEAIESQMLDWFAVGVQWHPESAAATAIDQLLFERFVEEVAMRAMPSHSVGKIVA